LPRRNNNFGFLGYSGPEMLGVRLTAPDPLRTTPSDLDAKEADLPSPKPISSEPDTRMEKSHLPTVFD
jgi:hypothetical protein